MTRREMLKLATAGTAGVALAGPSSAPFGRRNLVGMMGVMMDSGAKAKTPWITRIAAGNGINLGSVTDAEYTVEITFRHARSSTSEAIFGVYAVDNLYFRDGFVKDEKSALQISAPADNSAQTITFSRTNGTKSFLSTWGQSSTVAATLTKANWWTLFGYYYGVYPFYGSISRCKITAGGVVVKDLVAAKDGDKIGFIDSVSGSFIELSQSIFSYEETQD